MTQGRPACLACPPFDTPGALILMVKNSVLGGSVVTRVNLFTGGHLFFTGGAIANYTDQKSVV